jgi:hypothetical protein
MTSKAHITELSQGLRWVGGSSLILLIIGFSLSLIARLTLGSFDFTTVLLALSVSVWSYVLGFIGLGFLSLWLGVRVICERVAHTPAESAPDRTGNPALGPLSRPDPIPLGFSRGTKASAKAHGPAKAA